MKFSAHDRGGGRPRARLLMPAGPAALLCLALAGCGPNTKAPAPEPVFYPPLPERPRIQFLRTLASSDDVEPPQGGFARFVLGEDPNRRPRWIVRPYGMVLWEGKLYVCDTGGRRGGVFDFKEQAFRWFAGTGPYRLAAPVNMSIGPRGEKYVTDTQRGQILVLGADDKPIRRINKPEGMKPCDAVLHEGELFVADLTSNSILVLEPRTGRLLRRLGKSGSRPGEFFWPTNIAFGPKGHLYVCDTLNARVQKMDRNGNVVQIIGSRGTTLGKMVRPKGIAVDRAGRLYVADAATDSVQIFNPEGKLLLMLGGPGEGPGQMSLPAKVVVSYEGIEYFAEFAAPGFRIEYLILVSNQLGPNRINVYGFGTYEGAASEEGNASAALAPVPAPGVRALVMPDGLEKPG